VAAEKTLAFVLRTQDYRDTSLLATFYTLGHGKVKAIIKGGRDARFRMGSTLEPFSLNEILIYKRRRGGDLHMVTAADLVDRYEPVRRDLEKLGTASYFMELLDQMAESEAHPEVFYLVSDALNFLAQGHSPKRTARIFEVKLLTLLGFMPELGQCVHCETREFNEIERFFAVGSGGIVCGKCRAAESPLVMIPKGVISFLEQAMKRTFQELGPFKVNQEVGEKLERMMRQFLNHHLAYAPKSLMFLEKVSQTEV